MAQRDLPRGTPAGSSGFLTRVAAWAGRAVGGQPSTPREIDHSFAAGTKVGEGSRPAGAGALEDDRGILGRPEREAERPPAGPRPEPWPPDPRSEDIDAPLEREIRAYRAALDGLAPREGEDARTEVLGALVARDRIARILADGRPESPEQLLRVAELDHRLKDGAKAIDRVVGGPSLEALRETRRPPPDAWWWSLDERAAAAEREPQPVWAVLTGLCLFASFFLIIYISLRFLSSGADFISVSTSLAQVLLALLAISTLTQVGQRGVERALELLRIKRRYQQRMTCLLALGLLLALLGFKAALPWVADGFHEQGRREDLAGRTTGAIEQYERTIALAPEHALARYNLGNAYEEVREYDKAIAEYQAALLLDPELSEPRSVRAANNLARLYIWRQAAYGVALDLLRTARASRPSDAYVQYTIHKNLAWAYLGLSSTDVGASNVPALLEMADQAIEDALVFNPRGGGAYCLRALASERRGRSEAGLADWQQCLRNGVQRDGKRQTDVEAHWLVIAEARVNRGG